jgi:hypothetical protein
MTSVTADRQPVVGVVPKLSGKMLGTLPYWVAAFPRESINSSLMGDPGGQTA